MLQVCLLVELFSNWNTSDANLAGYWHGTGYLNLLKAALLETTSVAEPHHFYAAPAPGENFDAAPAPTLQYSKAKFLNELKFKHMLKLSPSFDSVRFILLKIRTEWVLNC
jgi:hypothetical protein